jgi:hypothetical protein
MKHASPNPSLWQRTVAALLRIVLLISATVLMIGAMLIGLVLASGVVLWALLRGRRPGPVNLRWGHMPRARGFGQAPPRGEVVDIQAREVDGPTLR